MEVKKHLPPARALCGTEILAMLRDGWELGTLNGAGPWLQKGGLCHGGGEVREVHFTSFKALLRHNHITELPRQPKDPAWLTRYGRGHRRAP